MKMSYLKFDFGTFLQKPAKTTDRNCYFFW